MLFVYGVIAATLFIFNLVMLGIFIAEYKSSGWEEDAWNVKYAIMALPIAPFWPIALLVGIGYCIYQVVVVGWEVFNK